MDPTIEQPSAATPRPAAPAEPKRGLSPMLAIGGMVVALIIGGLVGGVVGWKVEQNRVKDDVRNIRPVGTVTAVSDNAITVRLRTGSGERVYALTDATIIDNAEPGARSDIEEGSTVFLRTRRGSDGELEAAQVVVLPERSSESGG
jgi:hypothetical protein